MLTNREKAFVLNAMRSAGYLLYNSEAQRESIERALRRSAAQQRISIALLDRTRLEYDEFVQQLTDEL